MNIENLLHDEIQKEFEDLGRMELGSEKYKSTVDGLTKLVDRAIKIDELNIENQEKIDAREDEREIKLKQMEEDRKDRLVRNVLTGLGLVIPTGLTVWGTLKSLKFEETGTVTTAIGRGFINKLLPKK